METRFLLISILSVFLVAGAGARADERYSEWGSGDKQYDALVERLNELIDRTEKSRAADHRLLQDLHDAIADHTASAPEPEAAPDLPQQKLEQDDFGDGNFTRNPAWTVAEGRFSVDSKLGLRSVVAKVSAPAATSSKTTTKDIVTDVLGSLLGNKKKETAPAPSQPSKPERAEIFLQSQIPNAFQMVFELVSREKHDRFTIDLFQGRSRGAGYRLAYVPGGQPSLELQRFGSSGVRSIVAHSRALNLEDNFRHRIEINRDTDGGMTVSIDGARLLEVADRSFRDPFSGITIANDGGDYSIREITILGDR